MKTVSEVSKLTGVSVRTLQYYDSIGLLPASKHTESGYRLYDDETIARLSKVLLFRKLEFSLKEIKSILENQTLNLDSVIDDQIVLLELKKEHIDNLVTLARGIKLVETTGGGEMDVSLFRNEKFDKYKEEVKARWANTDAYKDFESRKSHPSEFTNAGLMLIFKEFGDVRFGNPGGHEAQLLVKKLRSYLTENYYECTDATLAGLGEMYVSDERFTLNIDRTSGEGTAQFVSDAIKIYCERGKQS